MTVVVAVRDDENKKIVIGTDKLGCRGVLGTDKEHKIVKLNIPIVDGYGEVVEEKVLCMGISGYGYLCHYIQYVLDVPSMDSNEDIMDYLYNSFFPVLRNDLIEGNLVELNNGKLDNDCFCVLVFDGEMFLISSSFGIDIVNDEFVTAGSGAEVAVGSIYTNLKFNRGLDVVEVVKQAIVTCGDTTIYCNNTFDIEVLKY